ncbi:hypothetical protein LTR57_021940 [Friedmanniomyces endolithicus]|nr:hypothetical protein LTR94_015385 [Friedmanniomyces endolithicus]KAK0778228.1 hypothetical protein LTR75_015717 [Friedmanniomyces endolithicus]KAK0897786.1 hypothetical protein LTR57_021940 [Friedmanniomyces endolithicus]
MSTHKENLSIWRQTEEQQSRDVESTRMRPLFETDTAEYPRDRRKRKEVDINRLRSLARMQDTETSSDKVNPPTLATSAVAKKLPLPGWDTYAEERGFAGHEDPREFGHGGLQAREAGPEAIESWEQAHGSKAAVYKPYGEHEIFGQHAPRAEQAVHPDHHGPGREQAGHHARSAPEHFGHPSEGLHGGEHHARAVPGAVEGHQPGDKYYEEYHNADGSHHARDAEAQMPYEHAAEPFHRPHQARDAEARMPYEYSSPAGPNEHMHQQSRNAEARPPHEQHAAEPFYRPHQARDAEDKREQQNYFSRLAL